MTAAAGSVEEQRLLIDDRMKRRGLCRNPVAVAATLISIAAVVALGTVLLLLFVPYNGRVQYCRYSADALVTIGDGRRRLRQQLFSAGRTKWASLTLATPTPLASSVSSDFEATAGANGTLQIVDGTTATLVDVFFGRTVCHKLTESAATTACIDTTSSAWVAGTSAVACPAESGAATGTLCTTWTRTLLTTAGPQVETYFVEKKSRLPRQYSVLVSGQQTVRNFLSFTVGDPLSTAFSPPSDVVCSDFTDTSNLKEKAEEDRNALVNNPVAVNAVTEAAKERGWVAGANAAFDRMTVAEFENMVWPRELRALGLLPGFAAVGGSDGGHSQRLMMHADKKTEASLPASFDSRTQWPQCKSISDIKNQGTCGSCYAMAAAATLSDRFCIATNATGSQVVLSPQWIVSCFEEDLGCSGGFTEQTWRGLAARGTVSEACVSFKGVWSQCPTTCDHSGDEMEFYRSREPYGVWDSRNSTAAIQREIMQHGPVEATFWVFSDFKYLTRGGVYTRTAGSTLNGAHAVRIIGWGTTTTGQDYWLVANSWGRSWGSDGFFKIARGTNECGLEDHVVAGLPLLV